MIMKKKTPGFKNMAALFIAAMLLTTVLSAAPAWAIGGGYIPGDMSDSIQSAVSNALNRDDYDNERDYLADAVLMVLNNQKYTDAMTDLREGDPIVPGSYSYTVAWLQQLLVDFTCNIGIDGYAGNSTFEAVNRVLGAFGMDPVEEVDKDVFATLLDLYLISTDEDASYALLYDYYSDGSISQYYYLRACALFAQEKYFSAEEKFLLSRYGDYEERAAQCPQPRPWTGELWHNGYMYSSAMYLTFTVNSYDEDTAMYFEVYTYDGYLASALFINGSGSATTSLPGGVYYVKDGTGETWYGMNEAFGRYGNYEYMEFNEYDGYPYLTNLYSGYAWTISVNVSTGTGTGVGSDWYDWESWMAAD